MNERLSGLLPLFVCQEACYYWNPEIETTVSMEDRLYKIKVPVFDHDGNEVVTFTYLQSQLLNFILRNPYRICTNKDITEFVWEKEYNEKTKELDENIRTKIREIRIKLRSMDPLLSEKIFNNYQYSYSWIPTKSIPSNK